MHGKGKALLHVHLLLNYNSQHSSVLFRPPEISAAGGESHALYSSLLCNKIPLMNQIIAIHFSNFVYVNSKWVVDEDELYKRSLCVIFKCSSHCIEAVSVLEQGILIQGHGQPLTLPQQQPELRS